MADPASTPAPAPAKRKRAAFTRTEKPIFAIVTVRDTDGNVIPVKKEQLSIVLEKDSAKIVDLVTSGEVGSAAVLRVTVPQAPKKPAPVAAA